MVLEGPDNKLRLKIMVGYKFNVADIILKRNIFFRYYKFYNIGVDLNYMVLFLVSVAT